MWNGYSTSGAHVRMCFICIYLQCKTNYKLFWVPIQNGNEVRFVSCEELSSRYTAFYMLTMYFSLGFLLGIYQWRHQWQNALKRNEWHSNSWLRTTLHFSKQCVRYVFDNKLQEISSNQVDLNREIETDLRVFGSASIQIAGILLKPLQVAMATGDFTTQNHIRGNELHQFDIKDWRIIASYS